jgi:flagellar P-ring protein precursor FlgI
MIMNRRRLPSLGLAGFFVLANLFLAGAPALGASRIKDIAEFEGVRANQLVGYGLVVGLNGTGDDTKKKAVFTRESLIGMLERLGVNARNKDMETKNVAAVMVTATLPAFARQGNEIDVTVSALGNATSLQGGTLLVTPMLGPTARSAVFSVDHHRRVRRRRRCGAVRALTSGRIAEGGSSSARSLTCGRWASSGSRPQPDFTTARRWPTINVDTGQRWPMPRPGTVTPTSRFA